MDTLQKIKILISIRYYCKVWHARYVTCSWVLTCVHIPLVFNILTAKEQLS